MKKLSAFFLLCLITVALTACGKPADAAPDSVSTDTTGSAAQTPTDTDGSGSGEESGGDSSGGDYTGGGEDSGASSGGDDGVTYDPEA